MAWNQHGNWIRSARLANRANCFSIADFLGHCSITQCLAATDALECLPNALLKIRAARQIERRQRLNRLRRQSLMKGVAGFFVPSADFGGKLRAVVQGCFLTLFRGEVEPAEPPL